MRVNFFKKIERVKQCEHVSVINLRGSDELITHHLVANSN